VDPQTLSTLMVGVLLAVSALGTRYSTQGRRRAREIRKLRASLDDAEGYIYQLRSLLHRAGVKAPELPRSLTADAEDDEE
jgi:hypothetical protein